MGHAYNSWDCEAAAQRALSHADGSGSSDEDGSIWNFAFGSNISAAKVRSRGMLPLAAVRGRLPGWTLLFNHTGGYANIEPADLARQMDLSKLPQPVPEETHGMLLRLSRREFAELARQEYAYDTVEVAVEVYDADGPRVQRALAFKTSPCALTTSRTLPSERYARIIREGAREAAISAPILPLVGYNQIQLSVRREGRESAVLSAIAAREQFSPKAARTKSYAEYIARGYSQGVALASRPRARLEVHRCPATWPGR